MPARRRALLRLARRDRSWSWHSPVGLVTATAMAVAYSVVALPAAPARAADPETTALKDLMSKLETFVPGLAGVGAFGQALPNLDIVPGSPAGLGLGDLLEKARTGVLEPGYGNAADVGQLVSAIDGKSGSVTGGGRDVSYTASKTTSGTVDTVSFAFHGTKHLTTAQLDISDDSPKFSLASDGGVNLDLTIDGSFGLNYDSSNQATWITTPSLSIGGHASLPATPDIKAGLGILGIKVADGSTLDLQAALTSTWSDPNNDGKLAFDDPGGAADDGELSAPGAGAGLVTTAMAAGSLHAVLNIVGRPSTAINLGDANVQVHVDADDLLAGAPQVTVTGGTLSNVQSFLNLSTRDLAQGLAQAASTVLGLQMATGVKLPFMRGDLANAVNSVQALTDYLTANVPAPTGGSTTPGLPSFASLQDMLEGLNAITGDNVVHVTGANWDALKKKVVFTIDITHAAKDAALDPVGTTLSGQATYTDTTLTDGGQTFDATLGGRVVNAGASSGIIESVSADKHTLTIGTDPADPTHHWHGGTPPDGSSYSVAAADPKTGAVELADSLKSGANGAIKNANAKLAQATVTPAFTLHLPIVLDLRDPTTSNCNPDPATPAQPCPYSYTSNGLTQVITSLPRAADRIMLRTGAGNLLTADAPISTAVDVDATVGFLGVKLKGTLRECTTQADATCGGTSADHLLTIGLKTAPGADADGDIPFTSYVTELTGALSASPSTLSSLIDLVVKGQAYADLKISVPGASSFFGAGTPEASVTIAMPDITDPSTFTVTPDTNIGHLGTFNLDPSNPLALFGALLSGLQSVQGLVGNFPGSAELDKPIPLLGKSFKDVIGAGISGGGTGVTFTSPVAGTSALTDPAQTFTDEFVGRKIHVGSQEAQIVGVDPSDSHKALLQPALENLPAAGTAYTADSELQGVINLLQDQSPSSLQDMLDLLTKKLGGGSGATFEVVPGTPDQLKLNLDWKRAYSNSAPLDLHFQLPAGSDRGLVGAQGTGLLKVAANGEIKLSLLFPLDAASLADPVSALKVDPANSFVHAGVAVNGDGVRVSANLGPFQMSLGNPSDPAGTELHASLGVALASPDTDAESLSDFASSLGITLNSDAQHCGGDTTTDLALCAVFPAYLNGTPVNSDATKNNFALRLPLGSSLSDTFSLDGTVDGTPSGAPRFEIPDGLATALGNAALSLTSFGDGFYGYLTFLENALRTASFDGKLPLIGKDLQAGSDFIKGLHTDMAAALQGVDPLNTTAGNIRTFLKDKVKPALPKLPGGGFTFDVECSSGAGLQPVGQPTATPTGGGTGHEYRYKVVAHSPVDNVETDTKPSDSSSPATNQAAPLDSTHYNTVTWTPVDGATGYKIYRAVDSDADADFKLMTDVSGQASASYTDNGTDSPGDTLDPATSIPCPDNTPADSVEGFTLAVDLGQGDPSSTGCDTLVTADPDVKPADKDCLTGHLPFDLGIPGLSIKSTPSTDGDGVTAKLGWRLHLKVGLDRTDGFFVETQDTDKPEFRVGASVDVGDLQARLAFINIDKTKHGPAGTHDFAGMFAIDLKDGASADDCTKTGSDACTPSTGPGSPRLTLSKLQDGTGISDFVKPLLTANVDLDWHLAARPGTGSALPGISTNFHLTWGWTSDAPGDFAGLDIAFNDVAIDAGDFLGSAIKPIIKQVVDVFKPVQPVIDILFEPIPLISDLSEAVGGDPITIASLAATFSTLAGGPDIQPFLDVLKNVRDLLKSLSGDCSPGPSPCITVGSFHLLTAKAVSTDANPGTAAGLINKTGPTYDLHNDVKQQVNAKASKPLDANGADADHPGFAFPFLDDPSSIFGLLVGQDVDLVSFDSGPLTLGFQFQESFGPVYAPPPVNIVVGGGASVTLRVKAGFDTYGIRTAIEKGKFDATILDSLFFYTTDKDGKPLPVVQFTGFLEAGASVSAVIIEVGVVGGIKLTINFYWNDPNNDGKFRFSEFLTAALNNPICLFNVGGELSLFIKVFITLGISPFSVSFDFTLVDVKLLDFSFKPDCTPPPPHLGGVSGGVLYLYAGKFGGKDYRAPGYSGDYPFANDGTKDEAWVIRQVPAKAAVPDPDGAGPKVGQDAEPAKVTVTALGISEDFDDTGGAITTVVLDGRGTSGALSVTFNGGDKTTPFSKKVVVATGSGKDTVRSGIGQAIIDGGGEQDQITTLERTDLSLDPATAPKALVSGGAGPDAITVGNGKDTVLGDRGLTFTDQGALDTVAADGTHIGVTGALNPTNVAVPASPDGNDPADGNDQISAGLGGSTIYGNGGDDTIGTANDNAQADLAGISNPQFYRSGVNTIVGGGGSDRIKSGSASDTIYTGAKDDSAKNDVGPSNVGTGDDAADQNTVDTGIGSDTVYGSNAKDFVTTHSTATQTATVYGGGADDVLIGGLGTDKLYGGPANDYLVAGPATVSSDTPLTDDLTSIGGGNARRVTQQPITPPVNQKTLVGGGGLDRIYGVNGPANIYGDHEIDACTQQADPVSKQPAEHPTTSGLLADRDAADLILGGEGVDTVQAGGGNDHVYLAGGNDVACGNAGDDTIFGGSGADLVYGGSDNDVINGDNEPDQLYGNTGDDAVYGGDGADQIEGNEGADFLTGGAGNDTVIGGTSKAGTADTGDRIYGDTGTDTLIGDNGDPASATGPVFDLANLGSTVGGNDVMFGGDDSDTVYGGIQNDTIHGNKGDDHVEGGPGSDTINGDEGRDDLIGGSTQVPSPGTPGTKDVTSYPDGTDTIGGDTGDDVILGDNGQIVDTTSVATGDDVDQGRSMTLGRTVTPYDLSDSPAAGTSAKDYLNGGTEPDLVYGQGGDDVAHGDAGDDYVEGGQGADELYGDTGQDDIAGGSLFAESGSGTSRVGQPDGGDTIRGGDDGDVVLGDNGIVDRVGPTAAITKNRGVTVERRVQPFDLGDTPTASHSGADLIDGDQGNDVLLGQGGTDVVQGGSDNDYAEGGSGIDRVEGNDGDDDLVGGSSAVFSGSGDATAGQLDGADLVYGGAGDDVALGDNGIVTRVPDFDPRTFRVGSGGVIEARRSIQAYDLRNGGSLLTAPSRTVFGGDQVSGGSGVDLLLGQDGKDLLTGEAGDDYAQGNGDDDTVYGDTLLGSLAIPMSPGSWKARVAEPLGESDTPAGQDDLVGGSSIAGFRDGSDLVHGDDGADYELGDNGQIVRDVVYSVGGGAVTESTTIDPTRLPLTNRVYAKRYPGTLPAGAAFVRHGVSATSPTRFCTTAQATCEPAGASGNDTLFGDAGDDTAYGQDGNDTIWGNTGDDDLYGELGDDVIDGGDGDDAILGDRGGIVDVYRTSADTLPTYNGSQVPKVTYTGFQAGSVTRVVDLLHDVNGDAFIGSGSGNQMPYHGDVNGGNDRVRGRDGHDSIHGGAGDDLLNGDAGGDIVFGDDGADVMWGGRGSTSTTTPNDRGTGDSYVDYLFGGKGGTAGAKKETLGSDIIDWRPRGTYSSAAVPPVGTCSPDPIPLDYASGKKTTATVDPCSWFVMTDMNQGDTSKFQHHQGIDWIYGGWDRDILQGDVADNGPNDGDRLLDWNGAYNLYSHCNSAYGGYNDVRQHSPDWQSFLQMWSYSVGAGQVSGDVSASGTSAFDELALAYPGSDGDHMSGAAFPSTPGHFDDPNACNGA